MNYLFKFTGKQEVSSTSTKVQKSIADKVNSSSANGFYIKIHIISRI